MIKAIFFDLDGTLLPMDEEIFTKGYFSLLCKKMIPYGYTKEDLVKTIWDGTKAMYLNDGKESNENVFWKVFAQKYGEEKLKDKEIFNDFYVNEFKETIQFCKENSLAKDIVNYCNKNFPVVVLSTNPIFPYIGTETRMKFVNLKPSDFSFVTTYENSSYCKPNPMYFHWLLEKFNLKPDEVILFGNNTLEDGECSKACSIKCYMVGNNIIHNSKSTHSFEEIIMSDIIPLLEKIKSQN